MADTRMGHELQLAGAKSTEAAKALLGEHKGDIAVPKKAEPWLFEAVAKAEKTTGRTRLSNAEVPRMRGA